MDPRVHFSTQGHKGTSLYGFDLTHFLDPEAARGSGDDDACQLALGALTHRGIYPLEQALEAIGLYDRAAFAVFQAHPGLTATPPGDSVSQSGDLALYVNALGRLHIRPADAPRVSYAAGERTADLGRVATTPSLLAEIDARHAALLQQEADAFREVRAALDRLDAEGTLADVLDQVIDHIEHVESVGFYVGDRFLALIDRYVNLLDNKDGQGFLTALRTRPYASWDDDECLVVAALHALFLSGRSVRFEEFNGSLLTAGGLISRLGELAEAYSRAGCEVAVPPEADLFERARLIREQTYCAPGKPWLRYRWIYGLNFRKIERLLDSANPEEPADAWHRFFEDDFRDLVSDRLPADPVAAMSMLSWSCIDRDGAGEPCGRSGGAAGGWVEYLMEKVVASAVEATGADYGMSSSLRNIGALVTYHEETLVERIHKLVPADFFTCFVGNALSPRLGKAGADAIASAVQKRMMFNRWHFIPGNLDRSLVRASRHWYYPPLVPDIAVHADMHRAAHNNARVKYSIRAPGPDMSRPPLAVARWRFRGFYDVRVVRMEGEEFSLEDLLRTRRRTLWLEPLYDALAIHLGGPAAVPLTVRGFQPGRYLDLGTAVASGGAGVWPGTLAAGVAAPPV
ncbi:MAG: hypothetical protein F8N37_01230 [Telmatospirillum sp.]|nr:hypothetical protein [Telmatospirillum sp.]